MVRLSGRCVDPDWDQNPCQFHTVQLIRFRLNAMAVQLPSNAGNKRDNQIPLVEDHSQATLDRLRAAIHQTPC